jgi:hypothetical protein
VVGVLVWVCKPAGFVIRKIKQISRFEVSVLKQSFMHYFLDPGLRYVLAASQP